jgi:hypothetical protein
VTTIDEKEIIEQRAKELLRAFDDGRRIVHAPTRRDVIALMDFSSSGSYMETLHCLFPGQGNWRDGQSFPVEHFAIAGEKSESTQPAAPVKNAPPFRKADAGKPRPTLLPAKALQNIVEVLEFGAEKYGRDNWRNVDDPQRYLDAALRHLSAMQIEGLKTVDKESGLPHIDHAACCLLFLSEIFREDYDAEVARAKAKLTSTMTDKKQ